MTRGTDERVMEIATGQHGVATRAQLLAAGVTEHVLDRRVRSGRLVVMHRGVYRVAALEPTIWTRTIAALLATHGRAISHSAAAALWDVPGWESVDMHVIVSCRRRVAGIHTHRSCLDDDEVTCLRGVRVTTRARTVLDLAGSASMREVEQMLAASEQSEKHARQRVRELLERRPYHAGSARLRRLITQLDASGRRPLFLRSKAEELALAMLRRSRVPEPQANVRIAGFEVDFLWSGQRLILEVDGYEFHGSDTAFHRDRDRDRALAAAGYEVLRLTWRQLSQEPEACLAAVCIALGRRMT